MRHELLEKVIATLVLIVIALTVALYIDQCRVAKLKTRKLDPRPPFETPTEAWMRFTNGQRIIYYGTTNVWHALEYAATHKDEVESIVITSDAFPQEYQDGK